MAQEGGVSDTSGSPRESWLDGWNRRWRAWRAAAPTRRQGRRAKRRARRDERRDQRRQPWEIRAQVEIDTLRAMAARAQPDPDRRQPQARDAVRDPWQGHLSEAEGYVADKPGPKKWYAGTRVEGAWGHIDGAMVEMVRWVFDDDQLTGLAPQIESTLARTLGPMRPERRDADAVLKRLATARAKAALAEPTDSGRAPRRRAGRSRRGRPGENGPPRHTFDASERETLATALQAAFEVNAANYQRLRRFQAKLIGASAVLFLLVVGLVLIGMWKPHFVPLCFPDPDLPSEEVEAAATDEDPTNDGRVVCPSSTLPPRNATQPLDPAVLAAGSDADSRADNADVFTVVLFALIGAALTSVAFVIRPAPATALPAQSIRLFQAIVKAETGILAAVLGLLFLRAGVVPGFTQVDTRSQILIYAVVFGASQQLVTRLIDARSDALLGAVKTNASPAVSGADEEAAAS
jgi:hypothetical protein